MTRYGGSSGSGRRQIWVESCRLSSSQAARPRYLWAADPAFRIKDIIVNSVQSQGQPVRAAREAPPTRQVKHPDRVGRAHDPADLAVKLQMCSGKAWPLSTRPTMVISASDNQEHHPLHKPSDVDTWKQPDAGHDPLSDWRSVRVCPERDLSAPYPGGSVGRPGLTSEERDLGPVSSTSCLPCPAGASHPGTRPKGKHEDSRAKVLAARVDPLRRMITPVNAAASLQRRQISVVTRVVCSSVRDHSANRG